ncbi:MAG: FAD-binding protein [Acidimicrobiia bacterium]|nr:FAD-binding protein [Acidimicrobiia bacterium]
MTQAHPDSKEALAHQLRQSSDAGSRLRLSGAGSKRRMGGPVLEADIQITTAALNKVLQYEPKDLTISVEAGLPWSRLQRMLAAERQMIPLDPPYFEQATVGGVVASNTCGPRRRLYGSARDHVIGMQFVTLEGKIIQSGGMVVKNVAGLDMGKLMIGSFGTLAALAVVNFKLTPMPPASRTFLFQSDSADEAVDRRDEILRGVLQPCAVDLLNPHAAAQLGLEGYTLAVQAVGSEKVVERYRRDLAGWREWEGSPESTLWESIREFTPSFLAEREDGAVVRLSGALDQLRQICEDAKVPFVARAGNGVGYGYFPDAESAVSCLGECVQKGWRGVVEHLPNRSITAEEQWPAPGDDFAVMEKIKNMMDPKGLLNKGRLYGRI